MSGIPAIAQSTSSLANCFNFPLSHNKNIEETNPTFSRICRTKSHVLSDIGVSPNGFIPALNVGKRTFS